MISAKYLIALCCVVAAMARPEEDKYTDKFDKVNLNEILENKRLLNAYVDCVMGEGKCTPEGKELKEHLQEAIETGCEKCTPAQEKGARTTIEHLIKHEPAVWEKLTAKYDPTGQWRKKYEDLAREHGIEIPKK